MGEGGLLDPSDGAAAGQQHQKQGSLVAAALVGQLLAFLLALVGLFSSLLAAKVLCTMLAPLKAKSALNNPPSTLRFVASR